MLCRLKHACIHVHKVFVDNIHIRVGFKKLVQSCHDLADWDCSECLKSVCGHSCVDVCLCG